MIFHVAVCTLMQMGSSEYRSKSETERYLSQYCKSLRKATGTLSLLKQLESINREHLKKKTETETETKWHQGRVAERQAAG